MESKQVGPGFAAEILGVDLSAAMLDGDFDAIKKVKVGLRTTTTHSLSRSTTRPGLASC